MVFVVENIREDYKELAEKIKESNSFKTKEELEKAVLEELERRKGRLAQYNEKELYDEFLEEIL